MVGVPAAARPRERSGGGLHDTLPVAVAVAFAAPSVAREASMSCGASLWGGREGKSSNTKGEGEEESGREREEEEEEEGGTQQYSKRLYNWLSSACSTEHSAIRRSDLQRPSSVWKRKDGSKSKAFHTGNERFIRILKTSALHPNTVSPFCAFS